MTLAVFAPVTSTLVDLKVMAGNLPASSHCGPVSSSLKPAGGLGSVKKALEEADRRAAEAGEFGHRGPDPPATIGGKRCHTGDLGDPSAII